MAHQEKHLHDNIRTHLGLHNYQLYLEMKSIDEEIGVLEQSDIQDCEVRERLVSLRKRRAQCNRYRNL